MEINGKTMIVPLISGGFAGLSVDISLFPLDTIKTRLQSDVGFRAAGGLRNIYNGIGPAALGSAPNAALFFCTYEFSKKKLSLLMPSQYEFFHHAISASFGEIAACVIRVPAEVIKQRHQVRQNSSSFQIFRNCLYQEGFLGLFRGYWSTVMREIPFSFIQYPLWEYLKKFLRTRLKKDVNSWQSGLCGACAGGISAGLTTPLDVAKTRIMLAKSGSVEAEGKILRTLVTVFETKGVKGLYSGVVPRSSWMALGGAIYFGVYEFFVSHISDVFH